ncbi:MAG: hypothetical protein U0175_17295 [Caldilineaceae bacterium]
MASYFWTNRTQPIAKNGIKLNPVRLSFLQSSSLLLLVALLILFATFHTHRLLARSDSITAVKPAALDFDIVYVRQPRHGDNEHMHWPDVFHPARVEPGSDLVLLHPDGSEELLVDTENGAVTDPFVSFDAQWVYYAYFEDTREESSNYQRNYLPYSGSDIYRINLQTREIQQLTHQEFTPNTGAGHWDESNPVDPDPEYNRLGYGILNLGPAPLAGGRVAFVSNRNGFMPTKSYTSVTLQLFVMDEDGSNVTLIAPMTNGSSLHPTPLADGRIMFSTYESQGLRDERVWGIWAILPDGRHWEPLVSAFKWADAFHFQTQLSNGDLVVEDYYNLNNFGFGALYRLPLNSPMGQPHFYPADLHLNPPISQTLVFNGNPEIYPAYMSFTPRGLTSITPFTNATDEASPFTNNRYAGKFTHPSAAPNNDLLVVWSPGPVNALNRPVNLPAPDAGLYLIPGGNPVNSPDELLLIKNNPNYNEVWPRAVVTYKAIHGVDEPQPIDWLPNDGSTHSALPAGTPYGLVGTSSFYKRESFPGFAANQSFDGLDAFNTAQNDANSNWVTQGAEAGKYDNDDIWAVRILAMEPNTHRSYGPNEGQHFFNHANEKLRILGEIPLRKFDEQGNPILDPEGNPDTSFLAKIPADTPFTFQMLDRNGMVLAMSQTWHQVRPGEMRANCGGCHAHSQQPLGFGQTAAAKSDYPVWDLTQFVPLLKRVPNDPSADPSFAGTSGVVTESKGVDVEFYKDIRPILQRSCVSCHTGNDANPPGNLVLDDTSLYPVDAYSGRQAPGDYMRLCNDSAARWGYPPVIGKNLGWRQTNASRYVRSFQSRRSLLIWKLFGERLDGWSNEEHPTESIPGDASTLPVGANPSDADLDYSGTIMPPTDSAAPALSDREKMNFARWIDLGCPINTSEGTDSADFGWFVDDLRPVLTVSAPRPDRNSDSITAIRFGMADAYSGLDLSTLSITATISINGRSAGAELSDLVQETGDGIYELVLTTPITQLSEAHLFALVKDQQGNVTRVNVRFSVDAETPQSANEKVYLPVIGR